MEVCWLLGIQMRCGTNYAFDLISKHPDCEPARQIYEDYALAELPYLQKYLCSLSGMWRKFEPHDISDDKLKSHAEKLVHSVLKEQSEDHAKKIFLTKTPSFLGIDRLPKCMPTTKVILLVRDGRSVAYSLEKSFSFNFFESIARWRPEARRLLKFKQTEQAYLESNCLIVRYEDLFQETEKTLRLIFEKLELDPDAYDYGEASQSPVLGSSDLSDPNTKEETIHWKPKQRDATFNPLKRYEDWPKWKQAYAEQYLNSELSALGYITEKKPHFSLQFVRLYAWVYYKSKLLNAQRLKAFLKSKLLES